MMIQMMMIIIIIIIIIIINIAICKSLANVVPKPSGKFGQAYKGL